MTEQPPDLLQFANKEAVCRELDHIGEVVRCWRLGRRETTRAYAHRLALHIQERIIDHEQLLQIVLSLQSYPTGHSKDKS